MTTRAEARTQPWWVTPALFVLYGVARLVFRVAAWGERKGLVP
jgi:hypothetical protein